MGFGPYAIFASGTGTNAMALVEEGERLSCPVSFILSNKAQSPLEEYSQKKNIPFFEITEKKKFEEEALEICREFAIEWLFLAGFLKILSPQFLSHFPQKEGVAQVINIHPSLLPKYPGLGGYKLAFENGDEKFGHTIHFVTEGVDEGPILYQKELIRDSQESLAQMIERGKIEENKSYAKILKSLIEENFKENLS